MARDRALAQMTASFHVRAVKDGTFDLLTVPFDPNARHSKEAGLTAAIVVDRLFAAGPNARVYSIDASANAG
jgi:hypothetical protein